MMDKKPNLIDRAHAQAKDISASLARHNQGIDLELLAEILNELRVLNGRLPNEDMPRTWLRLFNRFKRWIAYRPNGELK